MRMKPEDFDKVIDTNLKGTFYCTKLCINNMIKNRWGRVINISSVVGIRGNIGQSNYSASKAGIHSFMNLSLLLTGRVPMSFLTPWVVEYSMNPCAA